MDESIGIPTVEVTTLLTLLFRMALEEIDHERQRFGWELMPARMYVGHKLRALRSCFSANQALDL